MSFAMPRPRALVAGWFSFEEVLATVGDLLGAEVTVGQLQDAGWTCDLALAPYMGRSADSNCVDWRAVDPSGYDLVVFTTGPLFDYPLLHALLNRFAGRERWAVNVSVIDESLRSRFDRVVARDAENSTRADLAWTAGGATVPVVGTAFAPPQDEYGPGRHEQVRAAVTDWLHRRQLAAVPLDMDMYAEHRYPRTAAQVTSLIARCDVVVSMRLHAAVLALRAGRPVIAVDAVPGGGKVSRQMRLVDWPNLIAAGDCTPANLDRALRWSRSAAAADRLRISRDRARADVASTTDELRTAARRLQQTASARSRERAS